MRNDQQLRVGVDARSMFARRPRGTGRNLRDVYRALTADRPAWQFEFFSNTGGDDAWWSPRNNTRRHAFNTRGARWDLWLHAALPAHAWWNRVDLLHLPANHVPYYSPLPYVATIHDLIPLEVPGDRTITERRKFADNIRRAVRNATRIITPSDATRRALVHRFAADPARISVVPWAPDAFLLHALASGNLTPQNVRATAAKCGVAADKRYVLNFSGAEPRKNALGLIRATAHLPSDILQNTQILIVGCEPAAFRTSLEVEAARYGLAEVIRVRGFLPHEHLPALLRGAAAVALPSFAEGFGLPILDAFAAGAPVITSAQSSMPEVAGDAAAYCNPADHQSIATALQRALDESEAASLRAAGFARVRGYNWSESARRLGDALAQAHADARDSRRSKTPPTTTPTTTNASRLNLRTDCRNFRGDRPCSAGVQGACPSACASYQPRGTRVLVIKLGALGDVVRTAAILPAIKQRYPNSEITWVSRPNGVRILRNNPAIDRLLPFDAESICHLEREQFHVVLSLDKEPGPTALADRVAAEQKYGMGFSRHGVAVPYDALCDDYFALGLDDNEKFYRNTKSYPQLLYEALGWNYTGQRYRLYPGKSDEAHADACFNRWNIDAAETVVGLNTGAGAVFANKNWRPPQYRALIERLHNQSDWRVLLLGGPAEAEQNAQLAAECPGAIDAGGHHSELQFAALVNRCNAIVTGDTLGLHVAVALDVPVVALFGPTCPQEIDLFNNGEQLITKLPCAPCYRRTCDISPNCMESINVDTVWHALRRQLANAAENNHSRVPLPVLETWQ